MIMKTPQLFLILALGTTGAISCKKSGGGGSTTPLALAGLGVTAQVPEGATAEKAMFGEGQTITGPDLSVTVKVADKDDPKTLAEAKQKNDLFTPQNVKQETLTDGWTFAFEHKTGIGMGYWALARRDIGGKAIFCDATVTSPEQQANALAVCKSLK